MAEGHFGGPEHHGHFDEQNQAGLNELSVEMLEADPQLSRDRLMLILKDLPYSASIKNVDGLQVKEIVQFCVNSDNLYYPGVQPAIDRVMAGQPLAKDAQEVLSNLIEAKSQGVNQVIDENEKAIRQRLMFWVDYFDELLTPASEQPAILEPRSNQANPAA